MAGLPIQLEVTGEARRVGTDQEDVCGLLQDEPGRADRMPHRLDARHRAGLQRAPFHEGGVHPPDAVQLEVRTGPGVEEAGRLQEARRGFHRVQCLPSTLQYGVATAERVGQAGELGRRHDARAGAAVGQDQTFHACLAAAAASRAR